MLRLDDFENNFNRFLYCNSNLLRHRFLNLNEDDGYCHCKTAFGEFERFVVGSETLLTKDSVVNSICGKKFMPKEQAYICRDCATDGTCRFCRECFVKSEHIKHNYQLFTSAGGGYCDCGDSEAWKQFPRCSKHERTEELLSESRDLQYDSVTSIEEDIGKLSEDIRIRFLMLTKAIFYHSKYYILRPLCKDNDHLRREELGRELRILRSQCLDIDLNDYGLVLYSNEIHNFDDMIRFLRQSLPCTGEKALEYANIVDRDGRCTLVTKNKLKEIEALQQDILTKSKIHNKFELLCRVHHLQILAVQNFLLYSLRWLMEFTNVYPSLQLLLCHYMFYDIRINEQYSFDKSTFIVDVFTSHTDTWKMARSISSNFIMSAVMKEPFYKKKIAVEFVKNYRMLIDKYSTDDHSIHDSLVSLTCQFFTTISLANDLLENQNVLSNIIQVTYEELSKHSKPLIYDGVVYDEIRVFHRDDNETQRNFNPYERHLKSFGDVKFLMTSLLTYYTGYMGENEQSSDENVKLWTEKATENFMDYFNIFVKILSIVQETNTIERVTDHHVDRDPQWRSGILLMYDLVPCITLTSRLLISNGRCLNQAFETFRNIVNNRIIVFESKKRILFQYLTFNTHVLDNETPNKYISVIKPLHRFMSALLQQHSYLKELTTIEVDCLFDHALQMIVFSSQQSGNMWIRNGSVPYIMSQQMKSLSLSPEMFDRDVELIQQLALCMRPEEFIVKCIHKFNLHHYLTIQTDEKFEKKSLLQRVEDFLHLLIMTLFYRHRPNVGKNITTENRMEHIILHVLCIKPMAHSKLMKKLPLSLERYPKSKLMKLIDNVSDQTAMSEIVIFNPKKSLIINHFDRFSIYYSKQDRNEAELYVQNIFKNESNTRGFVPPNPIELTENFSGLYRYLSDPCFLTVLNKILWTCNKWRNWVYWSDTILDMALYLIGSCLLDDINVLKRSEQSQRRTLFVETALRPDLDLKIIENLESLSVTITDVEHVNLIKWTIEKWYEVKAVLLPEEIHGEMRDVAMQDESATFKMEMELEKVIRSSLAENSKLRRTKLLNDLKERQIKFLTRHADDVAMQSLDDHDVTDGEHLVCILCQEKSSENYDRPMVALAGAWRSTVLARHPFTKHTLPVDYLSGVVKYAVRDTTPIVRHYGQGIMDPANYDPLNMIDDIDRFVERPIFPMLDHTEETFITTCGHMMHYDCKTRYISDMMRHRQNVARTKGILFPRIFSRCPLCKCVTNIDIPIIRTKIGINRPSMDHSKVMPFNDWLNFFSKWAPNNLESINVWPDKPLNWWDERDNQLSNLMKMTIPLKHNNPQATNEELLSCLAFQVGVAVKLQPKQITKETYSQYKSISNSMSESSMQDILELDYAVSYTISVWEQILAKDNCSLLTDMAERHVTGLFYLIRAVEQSHEQFSEKEDFTRYSQHFLQMLQQMLFISPESSIHRVWLQLHKYNTPLFILEVDFFSVMTNLLFLRSSFRPFIDSNSMIADNDKTLSKFLRLPDYFINVVRLIYQFVSIQALLSLQLTNIDNVDSVFAQMRSDATDLWTDGNIDRMYHLRTELTQELHSLTWPRLTKYETAVCFTRAVLPFLRCSTFVLTALGYVEAVTTHFDNCYIEFNHLIRILGLSVALEPISSLPEYIRSHLEFVVANEQCNVFHTAWGTKLPHVLPAVWPRLVDLPLDYTDVVTRCQERGCSLHPDVSTTVTEMGMCLICGETFCLNGYCFRHTAESSNTAISGAQIHCRQYHAGYSLFINARNTRIVAMFYQARWQITLDPIYVDKYGESDIDLTKGNPLFLKTDAYTKLQRRWLDHSLGSIVNSGVVSSDFFV